MTEIRRIRRTGVFSLLLATALGCNGGGGGTDPEPQPKPDPVPTAMTVGPADPVVADGGARQLTATVTDQNGAVMTTFPNGATIAWVSRDGAVASVDGSGMVTALRPGTAWIRASVGNAADSTRVTVTAVATQVAVVGSPDRAGTTGRVVADSLTVRVTDRHGTGMAGVTVAFSTPGGGEITPATVVTRADGTAKASWRLGSGVGEQTATATVMGLTGSPVSFKAAAAAPIPASVTITPAFATATMMTMTPFGVAVRDAGGEVITGAPVTFSSTGGVSVTAAGVATAAAPGVGRVIASLGALADSATLAVLGPSSVLATAFPGGAIHADVQRGDTVRVPVMLDISRPSPTNELGSVQVDVVYNPAVLQFVRADDVPGNAVWNLRSAGRFGYALAATEPRAPGAIRLATLVLVVRADAAAGALSTLQMEFAEAPRSTSLASFSTPLVVAGRVRVR